MEYIMEILITPKAQALVDNDPVAEYELRAIIKAFREHRQSATVTTRT